MAKKIVDTIRRTGNATSSVRQLIVVQGSGKNARSTTLSTPIEKVTWGIDFRHGGKAVPMEQYAFRVGKVTYERFADAASVVLKKHNVQLADNERLGAQAYVEKAFQIIEGKIGLRILQELPEDAKPAGEAIAA